MQGSQIREKTKVKKGEREQVCGEVQKSVCVCEGGGCCCHSVEKGKYGGKRGAGG